MTGNYICTHTHTADNTLLRASRIKEMCLTHASLAAGYLSVASAPQRLVVGVGGFPRTLGKRVSRSSLGGAVCEALITACRPPPADMHDSSNKQQRSSFRDERGNNRPLTYVPRAGVRKHQSAYTYKQSISHETWDTAPFLDFDGIWCDRLLLGDPWVRTAVLVPHGEAPFCGESLHKVLKSFRCLSDARLVLFVASTPDVEHGQLDMDLIGEDRCMRRLEQRKDLMSCVAALECNTKNSVHATVLWIGAGSEHGFTLPLSDHEHQTLIQRSTVMSQGSIACALWASHAVKGIEFIQQRKFTRWDAQQRNRVASQVMRSMLSTRDEAVLRAFCAQTPVSKKMHLDKVRYEADKIFARLREEAQRLHMP